MTKTRRVLTSSKRLSKADLRYITQLKQQISKKVKLLSSTLTFWRHQQWTYVCVVLYRIRGRHFGTSAEVC